jgi:hypothetical protein
MFKVLWQKKKMKKKERLAQQRILDLDRAALTSKIKRDVHKSFNGAQ